MIKARAHLVLLSLLAVLASASIVSADSELQFDLNAISTRISSNSTGDPFSENFTGSLRLGHDSDSFMAGILIDGVNQSFDDARFDGAGWGLSHFSAKINLSNGEVVGGYLYLEMEQFSDGRSSGVTNTYEADIVNGAGRINQQAGQGYAIDGLTINGMFSDSTFAGIDISRWFGLQPVLGSFLNFSFDPGDDPFGTDQNSNIDIFVTVPLPTSGFLALAGVTILPFVRRRRLADVELGV